MQLVMKSKKVKPVYLTLPYFYWFLKLRQAHKDKQQIVLVTSNTAQDIF